MVFRGIWSDIAELANQVCIVDFKLLVKFICLQVDLDLLRKLHKLQDVEMNTVEASLAARIAAKDAL